MENDIFSFCELSLVDMYFLYSRKRGGCGYVQNVIV